MSSFSKISQQNLVSNVSWTLFGNFFYAACQWGLLIVLARLGGTEKVGVFSLALAITAPIFMFSNLQLRTVQATDTKLEYSFTQYFHVRIISVIVSLLIALSIILSNKYDNETVAVILIIAVAKSVEAISDIHFGKFQLFGKMNIIATSMILKGGLSFAIFFASFLYTKSLVIASVFLLISWFTIMLIYDFPNSKKLDQALERTLCYDINDLRKILIMSLPLGIVMGLISLSANIPRYVLQRFSGNAELGVFSSLAYLIIASGLITNAIGQAVSTPLAQYYSQGDKSRFQRLLLSLMGVGVFAGFVGLIVSLLFGNLILMTVYGNSFAKYGELLTIFMVVFLLSNIGSVLGFGLTSARLFIAQIPIFVCTVIVSIVSSLTLIPLHGLTGAVESMILSVTAQIIGSLFAMWYLLRV